MHPSPYSRGGESALSRPRYMGRYMTASDVEHIMQILYQAVHAGLPYHEVRTHERTYASVYAYAA